MANTFVGDNDHGDAVPPTDVLLQMIKLLREDVVHFANELNEVTHQRDEARREVCNWSVGVGLKATSQAVAIERGWDCFKSDTLSQKVSQEGFKENTNV
jgi:hypothetical protein